MGRRGCVLRLVAAWFRRVPRHEWVHSHTALAGRDRGCLSARQWPPDRLRTWRRALRRLPAGPRGKDAPRPGPSLRRCSRPCDWVRAILHNCARLGPESQNRDGRPDFRAYLEGAVAWVRQVQPARAPTSDRASDPVLRLSRWAPRFASYGRPDDRAPMSDSKLRLIDSPTGLATVERPLRRPPSRQRPSDAQWLSLPRAAALLDLSPDALRRTLERRSQRAMDGGIAASTNRVACYFLGITHVRGLAQKEPRHDHS
jgi:hypothetical protein